MTSDTLKILITNDDGYDAPGIRALVQVFASRHIVLVVAPETQQSGVGHGFTWKKPLFARKIDQEICANGFAISGTPADCIKFGLSCLKEEFIPDVVVSGINDGSNCGIASFYSGTIAGAREGAFMGHTAFAFSLAESGTEYLQEYAKLSLDIVEKIAMAEKKNKKVFYNVNFPSCSLNSSKGIKAVRQSLSFYDDHYEIKKNGTVEELWLEGNITAIENSIEYDVYAVKKGFITITPLHWDNTNLEEIDIINSVFETV